MTRNICRIWNRFYRDWRLKECGWRNPSAGFSSLVWNIWDIVWIQLAFILLKTNSRAVAEAPPPRNLKELRSFLGLLNYYGSFIRNLSTLLHPLNSLLQKGTKLKWSADCQKAFDSAKKSLTSSSVLVHYDPSLPIRVAADASSHGLGAVLSHVLPDGTEHPIAFAVDHCPPLLLYKSVYMIITVWKRLHILQQVELVTVPTAAHNMGLNQNKTQENTW